jgi:PmbA protein
LASQPFDGEGVRPEGFNLIEDGVLKGWFLDSATGRELGLATNGHAQRRGGNPSPGVTNLALQPGAQSAAELMADVDEGLYVTEMIGHGANLLTGDYSRGAAGFAIRNGALAESVSEITVAGNLADMFLRMVPASDLEYRFAVNAPTVAIEGMTVAGR